MGHRLRCTYAPAATYNKFVASAASSLLTAVIVQRRSSSTAVTSFGTHTTATFGWEAYSTPASGSDNYTTNAITEAKPSVLHDS